jgi:hypothetical protein
MNSKLDCYNKLKELEEQLRKNEYDYINISLMQRKIHYDGLQKCKLLEEEIKKLSQICNNIKE